MAALATSTYNFPLTIPIDAGYDGLVGPCPCNFSLIGQLIYPSNLTGSTPLVVIAHGNHFPKRVRVDLEGSGFFDVDSDITSNENYKGYTYLQKHLASRGYITASVDLDQMFGPRGYGLPEIQEGFGIKLRAWIILKNIEKLITDATIANGALFGMINSSRIYLIGHSRGGEAVVVAYHLLKTPEDAPHGTPLRQHSRLRVSGGLSAYPRLPILWKQAESGLKTFLICCYTVAPMVMCMGRNPVWSRSGTMTAPSTINMRCASWVPTIITSIAAGLLVTLIRTQRKSS